MRRISWAGLAPLIVSGCYAYTYEPAPAPPWNPAIVAGPPGGAIDPGYGYPGQGEPAQDEPAPGQPEQGPPVQAGAPGQPEYPPGYEDGTAPDSVPPGAEPGASSEPVAPGPEGQIPEPVDPGSGIGSVGDPEIDATLAPYGQWIEDAEYGRVWRPYPTVVGVDFTPYETCGSWVYTDYGWTFACDWDWGWLPFHFGQWAWLDDGWCWVRGYTWSPAWVEWRSGGGYVGWRPRAPRVRDHRRHGGQGAIVRDHRKQRDSDWRFTRDRDFGRTKIRTGLYKNAAEGLHATSVVSRPPLRGARVAAADVMKDRLHGRYGRASTGANPGFGRPGQPTSGTVQPPVRGTYQPPSRGTYQPPVRDTDQSPVRGIYQPPVRGIYQPPATTYQPPSRGTYSPPSRGSDSPPSRGSDSPPSRGIYQPPSRGSY
ncbi:MAG TPA: DUF6600 domain-containing protein, partial [Kofleriaceae bacterium]|nr:DUF6600 domain-containing protein [Kofleriaceae bacterium]